MSDFVYLHCPFNCGHFVKHEIVNGDEVSARLAAKVSMGAHKTVCENNPKNFPTRKKNEEV
jgi:hypothetical protein